ncbi:hypothetical protein GCM10010306_100290 [Streptomyces umbrinus]|uniref:hypothetical protein n=1 Tax=Streptomyces umbrinus TaxID=67370 RepID=UPI0016759FED|nr:hypothetical protein [Streptomyces umbrinus]GHB89121.1 hypothetical protein GCM10010306_100290 [Streptomyces umbrinus]
MSEIATRARATRWVVREIRNGDAATAGQFKQRLSGIAVHSPGHPNTAVGRES